MKISLINIKSISLLVSTLTLLAVMAVCPPVFAGPYADELAKCLVKSTTTSDQTTLIKWVFAVMALHPEVSSMSSVTEAQRLQLDQSLAKLFERLLIHSCKTQAKNTLRYEGSDAFGNSFGVLGETAITELYASPSVSEGMNNFTKYLNMNQLVKLLQ